MYTYTYTYMYTYIHIYIYMLTPPTTRKTADFAHLSKTVRQRLRKSNNPKEMQDSVDVKSFGFLEFLEFWILGFWNFGVYLIGIFEFEMF